MNQSEKVIPLNPDGYCDEMSGDWKDIPDWVIRRLNFLEEMIEINERHRCPLMHEICPVTKNDHEPLSCEAIKHCYPYLCDGSCNKCNEFYLFNEEVEMIRKNRSDVILRHRNMH